MKVSEFRQNTGSPALDGHWTQPIRFAILDLIDEFESAGLTEITEVSVQFRSSDESEAIAAKAHFWVNHSDYRNSRVELQVIRASGALRTKIVNVHAGQISAAQAVEIIKIAGRNEAH